MKYTPEQMLIAQIYETKAFSVMHNKDQFDKIMSEFEKIKEDWDKPRCSNACEKSYAVSL